MTSTAETQSMGTAQVSLPRITIKFCVQCKWNLRAAYFAQELLQTFGTSIGEICLVPVAGGVFTVSILAKDATDASAEAVSTLLWNRKAEGGFPDTKELKNRVRNIIDPGKDMGHIDRRLKKDLEGAEQGKKADGLDATSATTIVTDEQNSGASTLQSKLPEMHQENCEDCK